MQVLLLKVVHSVRTALGQVAAGSHQRCAPLPPSPQNQQSCKVTFASTSPLLLSPVPPPASLLDSAHDAHAASDGPLASSDGDAVVPVGADSSPFHIVLDHGLRVLQAGTVLRRLLPQLAVRGTHLSDVMAVSARSSIGSRGNWAGMGNGGGGKGV